MTNAWTRFGLAVCCIVQHRCERRGLSSALSKHLTYLKPEDLPLKMQPEFSDLLAFVRQSENRLGADHANKSELEFLSNEQVSHAILRIHHLYRSLTHEKEIDMLIAQKSKHPSEHRCCMTGDANCIDDIHQLPYEAYLRKK